MRLFCLSGLAVIAAGGSPAMSQVALPHVPNNAALQRLASTATPVVVRDSFVTYGDAPPLMYYASGSPCTLSTYGPASGDNGSQTKSADGKCWLASFEGAGADGAEWGVDFTGASSSDVALSVAATWASTSGQPIILRGGQIKLTGAATINLTNNSLICNAAPIDVNASKSGGILGIYYGHQGTTFLLTSNSVQPFALAGAVRIQGCNFYWPNQNGQNFTPITIGSSPFSWTNATGRPVVVNVTGGRVSSVSINGVPQVSAATGKPVNVTSGPFPVSPGQAIAVTYLDAPRETYAAPIEYPPLFTEQHDRQVNTFDLIQDYFINAYDVLSQSSTRDAFGSIHISNVTGYAIRYFMNLANVPETVTISNLILDSAPFQNNADGRSNYLWVWTGSNGALLRVFGNGDGSIATSSVSVQGITLNNSSIFGYRYGLWVTGTGSANENVLNAIFDGVGSVVQVDSGGCLGSVKVDGEYFAYIRGIGPEGVDNVPAFFFGTGPKDRKCTENLDIAGQLEIADGDILDVGANQAAIAAPTVNQVRLSVHGAGAYGGTRAGGNHYYAAVNMPRGIFQAVNNTIQPWGVGGSAYKGFLIRDAQAALISSNVFNGVYNPVDPSSDANPILVAGNTAINTTSSYAIKASSVLPNLLASANKFDKPNPYIDGSLRLPGGSTFATFGSPRITEMTGLNGGTATALTGSSALAGLLQLTPASGASASGALTLTLPISAQDGVSCVATLESGSGTWQSNATIIIASASKQAVKFDWTNGSTPLASQNLYYIAYNCWQF